MNKNPIKDQDRAEDLLGNWRKYEYVMFPQQRSIYARLGPKLSGLTVLEAGCGSGVGSYVLQQWSDSFVATDKLEANVKFAAQLYCRINFQVWDICQPWHGGKADVVVAVETLEHVGDPCTALKNLMGAANKEVWISTPNGRGKPRPPENPFHVIELTIEEMLSTICLRYGLSQHQVSVLGWEDFQPVPLDTSISPLVYRIEL